MLEKLKNLIRWFPVIWNDKDYDFSFIYAILKFKLQNISNQMKKDSCYIGRDREVELIDTVISLISKIDSDEYALEWANYAGDMVGFIEGKFVIKPNQVTLKDFLKKYKRYDSKVTGTDLSRAMQISYLNHQRAKKLLFKILETRIEYWWT